MFYDFLIALIIGLIFAALLVPIGGYRTRRQEEEGKEEAGWALAFVLMLVLLTTFTWAGGLWITPFGPMAYGVAWAPFVVSALFLALLLAAFLPRDSKRMRRIKHKPLEESRPRTADTTAIGVTFILALCVLVLAIGSAYVIA